MNDQVFAKVIYRSVFHDDDRFEEGIVPIPKDIINNKSSYRENVENLALTIADDGYIWINNEIMIPHSRLIAIKCIGKDGKIPDADVTAKSKVNMNEVVRLPNTHEIKWVCNADKSVIEQKSEVKPEPKPEPKQEPKIEEKKNQQPERPRTNKIVKVNRFFRGRP